MNLGADTKDNDGNIQANLAHICSVMLVIADTRVDHNSRKYRSIHEPVNYYGGRGV